MASLLISGIGMTGSEAQAVVTLSLASLTNPNALPVGQPVTFQVQLSGLPSGEELNYLAATIVYDGTLLDTPTVASGAIIPNPLFSPYDFVTSPNTGQADASFYTFGTSPANLIQDDGVFFTFSTVVLAVGKGSLSFSFVDAAQFDPADPTGFYEVIPATGAALNVNSVVVTPEPSCCVLLAAAGLTAAACYLNRRRSAAIVR
jgi:hypothetical protein